MYFFAFPGIEGAYKPFYTESRVEKMPFTLTINIP